MAEVGPSIFEKVDQLCLMKRDESKQTALGGVLTLLTPFVALAAMIVLIQTPGKLTFEDRIVSIDLKEKFTATFVVKPPTEYRKPGAKLARFALFPDPKCRELYGLPIATVIDSSSPKEFTFCGAGFNVVRSLYSNDTNAFYNPSGVPRKFGYYWSDPYYSLHLFTPDFDNTKEQLWYVSDMDSNVLQKVPLTSGDLPGASTEYYRNSPTLTVTQRPSGKREVTDMSSGLVSGTKSYPIATEGYVSDLAMANHLAALDGITFTPDTNNVYVWGVMRPGVVYLQRTQSYVQTKTELVSSIGGAWQLIFTVFSGVCVAWLKGRDKLCAPKPAESK